MLTLAQNLTVSSSQSIPGGTYNNVTITGTGILGLTGTLTVNGTLLIETGGQLSPNCNMVQGAGNFIQEANATLDICDQDGISANGNSGAIRMMGTLQYSPDGNFIYNGTMPGQITGTGLPATVRTLENRNNDTDPSTIDLVLSSNVGIRQLLKSTGGRMSVAGRQVRLLSDLNGTAMISNLNGGQVVGPVTVERFIRPNLNASVGYRHYSSPVEGQTVSNLATAGFTPVFNLAYNASPTPETVRPFPTVYDFDQAFVGSKPASSMPDFDQGYRAVAPTAPMTAGKGFTVHIDANAKVELTGEPRNGTYTVTGLMRGSHPDGGWQFLGNPYPSPLNWAVLVAQPNSLVNVGEALYVYESTGPYVGNYRSYINGIGRSVVALAQGFFVRSTADNGSVTFTNAARTEIFDPADGIFRRDAPETRPLLRLTLANAANTLADDAVLYAQAGATPAFDAHFDATKFTNPSGLNLAARLGSEQYSIKALPAFAGPAVQLIPLNVALPAAGSYVLRVAELLNLPTGLSAYLLDAQLGTRTALSASSSYAFSSRTTSANGRFSLELQPAGVALANASARQAALVQLYPNPASGSFHLTMPGNKAVGTVFLTNALGQQVLSRSFATAEADVDVSSLRAGIYQVHLVLDGSRVVRRLEVQ
ncbi:hypothetical protein GCM10023185_33980 [Hymenobacter saemangeumensis]|uniref:Secretion system C-terminal sorting domain-containing protein n=2 Tax=Hymenobacter saemangeumensis TaxID=1084522 RepID=A0ABP8IPN8_9BACT